MFDINVFFCIGIGRVTAFSFFSCKTDFLHAALESFEEMQLTTLECTKAQPNLDEYMKNGSALAS